MFGLLKNNSPTTLYSQTRLQRTPQIAVKANKWLSFDNNTSLYSMNYIQPIFSKGQDSVGSQLWQIEMQGTPVIPVYTEDGKYTAGAAMSGYASFNDGNSPFTAKINPARVSASSDTSSNSSGLAFIIL